LLSNAREPQAVMAGCRPLWLLSGGQAPESDSPRGEIIFWDSFAIFEGKQALKV